MVFLFDAFLMFGHHKVGQNATHILPLIPLREVHPLFGWQQEEWD